MSDSDERSTLGGPSSLQIIVKGGTTSSAYDKERAQRAAASEANRDHQDKQMAAAAEGVSMTDQGFTAAKLTSMRMMDKGSPRVVLYYLRRDKSVRQECVSEIVVTPDDSLFTLVCPKCLERGEPAGSAQIMVKQSHRKWSLDTRAAGDMVQLRDPDQVPFWVRICGTIDCSEPLRCSNLGCTWAVKIESMLVDGAWRSCVREI